MIEVLTMLGSWVSGLGAVSAVIYAIRVNQPKLNIIISSKIFNDEGDFTVDVFNNKMIISHISHIRLVAKKSFLESKLNPTKFSNHPIIKPSPNNKSLRQSQRLNIKIESGAYEQFHFSGQSLLNAYADFCDIKSPTSMTRMVKAQIVVYLTNGSTCRIDLPKSQYQKIKNRMLLPIDQRLSEICNLGINRSFPKDYSLDHKYKIIEDNLNTYERALKRHYYLQLPRGITDDDFWNNR